MLLRNNPSHSRQHGINVSADHLGVDGATENNFLAFDANGLPKDSGYTNTSFELSGAVATHEADTTSIHGIADTSDLALKSGNVNQFADITSAGADIEDAVSKKHIQNTDQYLDYGGANEIAVGEIVNKNTNRITYYVSPTGDDSNPGTNAEPFATIQHAINLVPDLLNFCFDIILKDGTYNENIVIDADSKNSSGFNWLGIWSDSWDASSCIIEADSGDVITIQRSSRVYFGAVGIRVKENDKACLKIHENGSVWVDECKLGDNGNTGTYGIHNRRTNELRITTSLLNLDANKVSIGIYVPDNGYNGEIILDSNATINVGDTVTSLGDNTVFLSDLRDAVTKKHDAVTVAGAPLTLSTQEITFNYDTNHFQLDGNNLKLKETYLTDITGESIENLSDVLFDSGTPADNNVLTYDAGSGKWKAEAPASGGLQNVVEDASPQLGGDLDGQDTYKIHNITELGIGCSNPSEIVEIYGGHTYGNNANVFLKTFDDTLNSSSSYLLGKSHNDTEGTKTTTVDTEHLGAVTFYGINTTPDWQVGARMFAKQDGNAGSYVPTNLFFETWSASAQNSNQLVLHNDGNVGIGTDSPLFLLHVGSGADSPIESPVLYIANDSNPVIDLRDCDGDVEVSIGAIGSAGIGRIGTDTAHSFQIRTSNANRIVIDKDGYVTLAVGMGGDLNCNSYEIDSVSGIGIGLVADTNAYLKISDKYIIGKTFTDEGINANIDALGAEGGEVKLLEGNYTIDGTITIDYNNTTLTGSGWGTYLNASADQSNNVINLNGKDYLTLRDLKVEGESGGGNITHLIYDNNSAVQYSLLDHLYLLNSDYYGIWFDVGGSTYSSVINSIIESSDNYGICLQVGDDTSLINNVFKDTTKASIYNEGSRQITALSRFYDTPESGIFNKGDYNISLGNCFSNCGQGIRSSGDYHLSGLNVGYLNRNVYYDFELSNKSVLIGNIAHSGSGKSEWATSITGSDSILIGLYSDLHDTAGIAIVNSEDQNNLILGNHLGNEAVKSFTNAGTNTHLLWNYLGTAGFTDTGINTVFANWNGSNGFHFYYEDSDNAGFTLLTLGRHHVTGNPDDNDYYDVIFNHENDNDEQEDFARIRLTALDVSDGTEKGRLTFSVADGVDGSMDDVLAIDKDSVKIGDGGITNYTEIKADGEINLHGTARVTKCITFSNDDLSKGGTAPTQVILGNYLGWSYDIGDDSVVTFYLPNDWASGTDVLMVIRWYIDEAYATGNGEVNWQIDWSATPADETEAVDAPTHSGSGTTGDQNIPATAKTLAQDTVVTVSGASLSAGDEIGFTLSRINIVDGNNPTADPVVTCVGIIYTADKLGTAT